ncbi:MAG: ATP-binding protein [Deltaproteobacteria bacterium]|jgi:hypothetical protein|nr:ATP-binding protein [Deltaproteobacteria bacterium]
MARLDFPVIRCYRRQVLNFKRARVEEPILLAFRKFVFFSSLIAWFMKKLPTGKQNFERIINGGHVYVDKTEHIYNLIGLDVPLFLSRPRRFGKSLLVSTMEHIFLGDRDLFKGFWLYNSDYDWQPYPVIHLDLSRVNSESPEKLENNLVLNLSYIASKAQLPIRGDNCGAIFDSLIIDLANKFGKRVVVLIDEYDSPILNNIFNDKLANKICEKLQNFYGILKGSESNLRYVFITGVSKFPHSSIFSKLNNLNDITLDPDYNNICGFTKQELKDYFYDHLDLATKVLKRKNILSNSDTSDVLIDKLISWYDGYSWDGESRVFNPYSILKFLQNKKFSEYWYSTATPTFLYNLVRNNRIFFTLFNKENKLEDTDNNIDIGTFEPIPLMFQTGYLTISHVVIEPNDEIEKYALTFPNKEVRMSFFTRLMELELSIGRPTAIKTLANSLFMALSSKNKDEAEKSFESLLSFIPYNLHVPLESYYHTVFFFTGALIGQPIDVEEVVGDGVIDAVLDIPGGDILVIEMKHMKLPKKADGKDQELELLPSENPEDQKPTEEELVKINQLLEEGAVIALQQIKNKRYDLKYQGTNRKVTKVAMVVCRRTYVKVVFENT